MTDAFTRATPIYRAALRHPHKSGSAFQEFRRPRDGSRILDAVLAILGAFVVIMIIGVFL